MNRQVTFTNKEAQQLALEIAKLMESHIVGRQVKPDYKFLDEALTKLTGKKVVYFK
jgi:hypothetical protein